MADTDDKRKRREEVDLFPAVWIERSDTFDEDFFDFTHRLVVWDSTSQCEGENVNPFGQHKRCKRTID
jgi:hypothetical protein